MRILKPNKITYIIAIRAAKICMSPDLTKQFVNRAQAALKFTRHSKSASGMFESVILLTRYMTHTRCTELDAYTH